MCVFACFVCDILFLCDVVWCVCCVCLTCICVCYWFTSVGVFVCDSLCLFVWCVLFVFVVMFVWLLVRGCVCGLNVCVSLWWIV